MEQPKSKRKKTLNWFTNSRKKLGVKKAKNTSPVCNYQKKTGLFSSLHYVVSLSFLFVFVQWSMFWSNRCVPNHYPPMLMHICMNFPSPLELFFSPNYDAINRKSQPIEHTLLYKNKQNKRKTTQWRLLVLQTSQNNQDQPTEQKTRPVCEQQKKVSGLQAAQKVIQVCKEQKKGPKDL